MKSGGYTLYAEEIIRPLDGKGASNLIGHTIYKAPTLSTAAFGGAMRKTAKRLKRAFPEENLQIRQHKKTPTKTTV